MAKSTTNKKGGALEGGEDILLVDWQEILGKVDVREAKGKKILVTGANGFLGQNIVGALSLANQEMGLGAKIDAVGLHAPRPVFASLIRRDKNISYKKIDLLKNFTLGGYDYIFHAAGYGQPARFISDPYATVAINIDATRRLLWGSPGATFVFFSSGEIYGDVPPRFLPVREEFNGNSPLHLPRSVYAESKRLGEALCAAHAKSARTTIKIVRISLNYGPGLPRNDTRVMSDFIKKALEEKEIGLLDGGQSIKTYGYAADTVAMILFVAFEGKDMVYNVGGKDEISILELAKKIASICSVSYNIPREVSSLAHIGKDPKIIKLDLTKIKREMKKFTFTPFAEGLARTIEWQKILYTSK